MRNRYTFQTASESNGSGKKFGIQNATGENSTQNVPAIKQNTYRTAAENSGQAGNNVISGSNLNKTVNPMQNQNTVKRQNYTGSDVNSDSKPKKTVNPVQNQNAVQNQNYTGSDVIPDSKPKKTVNPVQNQNAVQNQNQTNNTDYSKFLDDILLGFYHDDITEYGTVPRHLWEEREQEFLKKYRNAERKQNSQSMQKLPLQQPDSSSQPMQKLPLQQPDSSSQPMQKLPLQQPDSSSQPMQKLPLQQPDSSSQPMQKLPLQQPDSSSQPMQKLPLQQPDSSSQPMQKLPLQQPDSSSQAMQKLPLYRQDENDQAYQRLPLYSEDNRSGTGGQIGSGQKWNPGKYAGQNTAGMETEAEREGRVNALLESYLRGIRELGPYGNPDIGAVTPYSQFPTEQGNGKLSPQDTFGKYLPSGNNTQRPYDYPLGTANPQDEYSGAFEKLGYNLQIPSAYQAVIDTLRGRPSGSPAIEMIARYISTFLPGLANSLPEAIGSGISRFASEAANNFRNDTAGRGLFNVIRNKPNNGEYFSLWPSSSRYEAIWEQLSPAQRSQSIAIYNQYRGDERIRELGKWLNGLMDAGAIAGLHEFDPVEFIAGACDKGLKQADYKVTATLTALNDITAGTLFPNAAWNTALANMKDNAKKTLDDARALYGTNVAMGGVLAELLDPALTETVANIPLLILAYIAPPAIAGSAGAILTTAGENSTVNTIITKLANSPAFWWTVITEFGSHYEEAIEDGANKAQAVMHATCTSFMDGVLASQSGNTGTFAGDLFVSGLTKASQEYVDIASKFAFYKEGTYDIFTLRAIWGSFLDGVLEELLSQGVRIVGKRFINFFADSSIDLDHFEQTSNGFALLSMDKFKEQYKDILSQMSGDQLQKAYDYYFAEAILIDYGSNGAKMNFMEFFNQKMLETSGMAKPAEVAEAFIRIFNQQYDERKKH